MRWMSHGRSFRSSSSGGSSSRLPFFVFRPSARGKRARSGARERIGIRPRWPLPTSMGTAAAMSAGEASKASPAPSRGRLGPPASAVSERVWPLQELRAPAFGDGPAWEVLGARRRTISVGRRRRRRAYRCLHSHRWRNPSCAINDGGGAFGPLERWSGARLQTPKDIPDFSDTSEGWTGDAIENETTRFADIDGDGKADMWRPRCGGTPRMRAKLGTRIRDRTPLALRHGERHDGWLAHLTRE